MTKKDYILIAQTLRDDAAHLADGGEYNYVNMSQWEKGCYDQWHTVVLAVRDALQRDNPRFDRAKFLAACGVQS